MKTDKELDELMDALDDSKPTVEPIIVTPKVIKFLEKNYPPVIALLKDIVDLVG